LLDRMIIIFVLRFVLYWQIFWSRFITIIVLVISMILVSPPLYLSDDIVSIHSNSLRRLSLLWLLLLLLLLSGRLSRGCLATARFLIRIKGGRNQCIRLYLSGSPTRSSSRRFVVCLMAHLYFLCMTLLQREFLDPGAYVMLFERRTGRSLRMHHEPALQLSWFIYFLFFIFSIAGDWPWRLCHHTLCIPCMLLRSRRGHTIGCMDGHH
jgi:hypothetical protein